MKFGNQRFDIEFALVHTLSIINYHKRPLSLTEKKVNVWMIIAGVGRSKGKESSKGHEVTKMI